MRRMKKVDNLYFTNGLVVHVNQTAKGNYIYSTAFATPINPSQYPYKYAVKSSVIEKIDDGGSYNVHYYKSLKELITKVKKVSGERLIRKSYYK